MKKEELLAMGLTEEQAVKVFELNGKAVEKAKGSFVEQGKELESLRAQLAEKDKTIASLEKAGGDAEAIRKELEKYKQAEADRRRAEKEAETDRILTAAAEQALEGKAFVNDYTRAHFLAELKKAIADPANKGRSAAKLFEDMTRDAEGTTGPHWTMEKAEEVRTQMRIQCDPLEWWVAMNMMCSDYVKAAEKTNCSSSIIKKAKIKPPQPLEIKG